MQAADTGGQLEKSQEQVNLLQKQSKALQQELDAAKGARDANHEQLLALQKQLVEVQVGSCRCCRSHWRRCRVTWSFRPHFLHYCVQAYKALCMQQTCLLAVEWGQVGGWQGEGVTATCSWMRLQLY